MLVCGLFLDLRLKSTTIKQGLCLSRAYKQAHINVCYDLQSTARHQQTLLITRICTVTKATDTTLLPPSKLPTGVVSYAVPYFLPPLPSGVSFRCLICTRVFPFCYACLDLAPPCHAALCRARALDLTHPSSCHALPHRVRSCPVLAPAPR